MAVLISQFPIDLAKLEIEMPTLWERWDTNHSGYLTKSEVIGGEASLLHFVTTELLKEPAPGEAPLEQVKVLVPQGAQPGQTVEFVVRGNRVRIVLPAVARPGTHVIVNLPPMPPAITPQRSFERDARQWFATFDTNGSGKLTRQQLLRALVKTKLNINSFQASQLINDFGLVPTPARGAAGGSSSSAADPECITLENFLAIHEILRDAVRAGNTAS